MAFSKSSNAFCVKTQLKKSSQKLMELLVSNNLAWKNIARHTTAEKLA